MNAGHRISIIVPVYNTVEYLAACLDSICGQKYKKLEIILVDDGSTDGSSDLCDLYAQNDTRIKVIHQENKGVWHARSAALEVSTGEYISLVDSDDWISPDMYGDMSRKMEESGADIVICRKNISNEDGSSIYAEDAILPEGVYDVKYGSNIVAEYFFHGEGRCAGGYGYNLADKLFKRDLLIKNHSKVDSTLRYLEDADCAIRCIFEARRIAILSQPYYFYRQRASSACHSIDAGCIDHTFAFYKDVRKLFEDYSDELLKDLDSIVAEKIVHSLNEKVGLNLHNRIPAYIPRQDLTDKQDRIALYGAGKIGKDYHRALTLVDSHKIVLWVDKKAEILSASGLDVRPVRSLLEMQYDKVLIAVQFEECAEEIKKELTDMGVEAGKIIWAPPVSIV